MKARRFSARHGDSMYAESVLIADPDPSLWQELSPSLFSWLPNKQVDFCTTRDDALDRVADPSCDMVISSARFAASQDFFLLKSLKCLSVPLVITTGRSTVSSSRLALQEGAFGVIRLPLDAKLASQTVILAIWVSDILRRITAYRDRLQHLHAHFGECPQDPELEALIVQCNAVFETTYDTCQKTITSIEKSVLHLIRTAIALGTEARVHAYAQLRELEAAKNMG